MEELTTEQLKQTEFNVLCQVAEICESQGFRYFLDGGTLIGAIRHKGFIPWDDDIDISMPRPDYDKFIEYCKNNDAPFGLSCHELEEKCGRLYAKAYDKSTYCDEVGAKRLGEKYGVFVDIFPIDGLADTRDKAVKLLHKSRFNRTLLNAANWEKFFKSGRRAWYWEPMRFLFFVYSRFFNPRKLVKKIEKIYQGLDFDKCEKVGVVSGIYGDREVMNRAIFEDSVEVEFEGRTFRAPIGYDEFLTNLYGDYMKLPPEEKRKTSHMFVAYKIDATEKEDKGNE